MERLISSFHALYIGFPDTEPLGGLQTSCEEFPFTQSSCELHRQVTHHIFFFPHLHHVPSQFLRFVFVCFCFWKHSLGRWQPFYCAEGERERPAAKRPVLAGQVYRDRLERLACSRHSEAAKGRGLEFGGCGSVGPAAWRADQRQRWAKPAQGRRLPGGVLLVREKKTDSKRERRWWRSGAAHACCCSRVAVVRGSRWPNWHQKQRLRWGKAHWSVDKRGAHERKVVRGGGGGLLKPLTYSLNGHLWSDFLVVVVCVFFLVWKIKCV